MTLFSRVLTKKQINSSILNIPYGGIKMDNDKRELEKSKIQTRLKKIEGQVRGVQRMIENGSSCSDVLIQIAAIKSAVNKVGTLVFENHAQECLRNTYEGYDETEGVEELMKILSNFIK